MPGGDRPLEERPRSVSGTETSSFGTGKRESHDSSRFYARNMLSTARNTPLPEEKLEEIKVPPLGEWADKIYCSSSTSMNEVPDNSVALAFTSPPYNVGKDYDDDIDAVEYLELIKDVGKEVFRVLRPGGRYLINVANVGRKPYLALHSLYWQEHLDVGYLPMGEIIWQKAQGASGSCAWGSWMSAKAPRLRDIHEYILVLAKQAYSRPDRGESDISRNEFLDSTLSVWNISPESAKRVGHPAPFPVALASRVIRLYSYVGDTVLDPFLGSGTTCLAAAQLNRHFVGYDTSREYCDLAARRLSEGGHKALV